MPGLSILAYNFDGQHPFAERRGGWMADYIERMRPDICLFQQVSGAIMDILRSRFGKIYRFYEGQEGLLVLTGVEGKVLEGGDEHSMTVELLSGALCVVNVCLPVGDEREDMRCTIMEKLVAVSGEEKVIMGGFFAIGRDDEHLVPEKLENMLFASPWCDLWHAIGSPHLCRYTFEPLESVFWADKLPIACRPSRILASWRCEMAKYSVCMPEMSFHRAIFVRLQDGEALGGAGVGRP